MQNKRNCDIAAMIARVSYISLYISHSHNDYTPSARSWLPTSVHVYNEGKTEHNNVIFVHYFVDRRAVCSVCITMTLWTALKRRHKFLQKMSQTSITFASVKLYWVHIYMLAFLTRIVHNYAQISDYNTCSWTSSEI